MKHIFKTIIKTSILFLAVLLFNGCETTDIEVVDSPNGVKPSAADSDLFLNAIQLRLADFITGIEGSGFKGMSEFGMEAVRMTHGFGPSYRELNDPGDFNQVWGTAYSSILADIRSMTPISIEKGQFTHVAITQIVESYVMMTLVDYFGDVPYTEAVYGTEGNFNPKVDSGASIYEAVDLLLIDAISNLNKEELSSPKLDLYFNGDENKWEKLANTLRLKLHLQQKLENQSTSISTINALINGNNLILDSADDFQFQYSANSSAPDSRHPYFEKNFGGSGPSSGFYFSNYYMNLLANSYSTADPRTRYYFYRQVSDFSGASVVTKECTTQNKPSYYSAEDVFCTVPNTNGFDGFWGRDHLDNDGIPPDDQFRTLFGAYPVGGPFDDDSDRNVSGSNAPNEGFLGAGISPIMLSSFTNFMLAEAALTLGTTGSAGTYLENGIRTSISKTMNFGLALANVNPTAAGFIPSSTYIDNYVAEVMTAYNMGSDNIKLKIIAEQYFIALWGNGIEAYNTYRRTGQPNDLQPAHDLSDPGVFVRSHWYPAAAADNNINITQKSDVTTPVFWDKNPEGFVD
ncbi:SusD/RagB family nutrient-binding outer membrane lipoprotein [Flavobacteriaceae bacterium]|nr:SusD/RagB family nutrient-binding outer membrane lipoprotein [Flavobacteriaceae bacterium]